LHENQFESAPLEPSALWDLGYKKLNELSSAHGFDASESHTGLYPVLFGRDSLWILMFVIEALRFRHSQPLARWAEEAGSRILGSLCDTQGNTINDPVEEQPGKIVHEYMGETDALDDRRLAAGIPFDGGRSYAGFDQTFLFVTAYRRYAHHFPESSIVVRAWPHVKRALEWIETYADHDGDGLFEYQRRHPRNLVNQAWKDSYDSATHAGLDLPEQPLAWIEVQAYAYRALLEAAGLFASHGDVSTEERLSKRAASLRSSVEERFWLEEHGCYAMALDGSKRPLEWVSSNASHTLWAEMPELPHEDELIHRLMQPDMMTPYGLRTLSSTSHFYAPFAYHRGNIWPFDNAVFAAGLLGRGRVAEARKVMESVGRALLAAGTPLEVFAVLEPEIFIAPRLSNRPALTYYRMVVPPGGGLAPQNQNQGWTAAALMFFGAALAAIEKNALPDQPASS
jgi:glycogen debranching enzyme